MIPPALDHLVLPCGNLEAAACWYRDRGFQVGRRNRHPWGTENHIIQFPDAFLELIAPAADAVPPAPDDPAFPFAGFLAGQGVSRDPSGMIVLRSADADGDAAAFQARGIGTGHRLDFSREGVGPDGGSRTVAFSLAFAQADAMPDIGFFTCQHHHPANFWDPAKQVHPNGATGIGTVTVAASAPEACADFLSRFCGTAPQVSQAAPVFHLGGTALRVVHGEGCARLSRVAITGSPSGDILLAPGATTPQRG